MEAFDAFVRDCQADLKRISRHSSGEYEFGDVRSEAWEMAAILADRQGVAADFSDPTFRKTLLSHLYQKLVRYQERNVRYAVRLDHAPPGSDEADAPHPLLNILASGDDPLSVLLAAEHAARSAGSEEWRYSLANAYVTLLEHFDRRMSRVADHLLISTASAYQRFREAVELAQRQTSLQLAMPARVSGLRPWRRYRSFREPRQLEFDFPVWRELQLTQ